MTMAEIRKAMKEQIKRDVIPELKEYDREILGNIETLWKNGYLNEFSNDFLKIANGYLINSGNYEGCHIATTLDLRVISMDKKTVKEFGEYIVNLCC